MEWFIRPTVYNENYKNRIIPFNEIGAKSELKEIYEKNSLGFVDSASTRKKSFWINYFDNYYTTPAAFIDYLNIILKTQWFLKLHGIRYKMFNGWDVFTTTDGKRKDSGADSVLSPHQFGKLKYENIKNTLLKDMYPGSSIFWDMLDFKNYLFFENETVKFGGLTQWVQDNLESSDWYISSSDKHPSTTAHLKFSQKIIIPILTKMWESDK